MNLWKRFIQDEAPAQALLEARNHFIFRRGSPGTALPSRFGPQPGEGPHRGRGCSGDPPGNRRILIASELTDLMCMLIVMNRPQLQADTLIVRGTVPVCGLEMLVSHAHIRTIIPQGSFHKSEQQRLKVLAEKYQVHLPESGTTHGFLINLP